MTYTRINLEKKNKQEKSRTNARVFLNMVNRGKMSLNVTASLVFDRAFLYKVGLFIISFERLKLHVPV